MTQALLTETQLTQFIKTGMVNIKLPDEVYQQVLCTKTTAFDFFRQDLAAKQDELFTDTHPEGYLDQRLKGFDMERFITRGEAPTQGKLLACREQILALRTFLKSEVNRLVVTQVFEHLQLAEFIPEVTHEPDSTLSIVYYPTGANGALRLAAHQDTSLVTTLWFDQPAYQGLLSGKWQDVALEPGEVLVQAGKLLAMMTNNQCHALSHRVNLPTNDERLSMAAFYVLNVDTAVKNYFTNEIYADTFQQFKQDDLQRFYQDKATKQK